MPKVVPEYREEAKNRILEAALQEFSEKGFYQTTMDDVAKRVGVSKGALYLYFNSKEELFKGIYEKAPQILGDLIRSSFKGDNFMQSSSQIFDNLMKQYASNPGLSFEIFAEATRNPGLKKVLRTNYDEYVNVMVNFLKEQKQQSHSTKDQDLYALAQALISLWNGMEALLVVGYPVAEVKRAWLEALRTMFLH
jgi:AcrR family transcriptional regulator